MEMYTPAAAVARDSRRFDVKNSPEGVIQVFKKQSLNRETMRRQ
jgi:hypothetical protein